MIRGKRNTGAASLLALAAVVPAAILLPQSGQQEAEGTADRPARADVGDGVRAAAGKAPQRAAFANRVATFNVCNPCDQLTKAEVIAAEIATYRPQVIGLQEICVRQSARVRDILRSGYGLRYHLQHGSVVEHLGRCGGTPWDPGNFGNAVLSAAPISSPVVQKYPRGGSEPRGYVAVTTSVAGRQVRVFTTHLAEAAQAAVRAEQVRFLADRARQHPGAIVLGDLNATPDAPELTPLWNGFRDADPACEPPGSGGCQATHPGVRKKFDYVFLDRGRYTPRGVGVHDTYSDHSLVHADLS
ncbi:endonuclease/exonuclease/phosphatase family protein [Streptomyces sp. A7024]|uniref:Endonuclease/exonuclease/phosphatase family protein n=1 Tax=Streptomyces coryli TaxID=1128680 RepID=A0A6G4U1B5_9ACTN|nr:endonuclease/exonuclease/phosphatase family protein [Streptomyces coryli]NGN65550.1 endonuclease/exonuclease/phosphatase family protein [Streptomyces coryli]